MGQNKKVRVNKMALTSHNILVLHKKSPWMPMWWSAALPGLGHICQGAYLRGLLLMSWEILINLKASLNLAILYTFTGNFALATQVLDIGWALFYGVIYCFSIYDSYRLSVETNSLAQLEHKQSDHYYKLFKLDTLGINYLNKKIPWVALAWSALLTGFGHLYNMKIFKAGILLGWAVAIIFLANINSAIAATFTGNFHRVEEIINYQWLLFFPSIYVFALWDSYNDAVEQNKLFNDMQKSYLKKKFSLHSLPAR